MAKRELISQVIDCIHYSGCEKQKINKYRQLISMYNKHRFAMTDIILNLHKYGSFKAYFYLLTVNKSKELENLIFSCLINILRDDVRKYDENIEFSNLAKWMPRENMFFDKKLNFVNRFVLKFYPELFKTGEHKGNLNHARRAYRQLLSKLNQKLETLEVLLSQKEGNVEYANLSSTQLNKYFFKFLKEDNTKFIDFMRNKYLKQEISILDSIFENKIVHDKEKEICNEVWNIVKYKYFSIYRNMFDLDSDLMVDITQDMYNDKILSYIVLVIIMFTDNKCTVYMNQKKIIFENDNIFDNVNTIKQHIYPIVNIEIPKNSICDRLSVVTTKNIDKILNFENYKLITIIQPSSKHNNIFVEYLRLNKNIYYYLKKINPFYFF